MDRIPEPELMEGREEALAYARADFCEPHDRFVALFKERFPGHRPRHVLDLGCGPGDICIRFARAYPESRIDGVDGSPAMLDAAGELLARAGPQVSKRLNLIRGLLPGARPPLPQYDTIISNSLLHHLAEPLTIWHAVRDYAAPGAAIHVMDLMRPGSVEQAQEFSRRYCEGEPEILKEDFYNSLLAAYTLDEVRAQLHASGLGYLKLEAVSDRHLLAWGNLYGSRYCGPRASGGA